MTMDVSHKWRAFTDGTICTACYACECHEPEKASQPCSGEFAS